MVVKSESGTGSSQISSGGRSSASAGGTAAPEPQGDDPKNDSSETTSSGEKNSSVPNKVEKVLGSIEKNGNPPQGYIGGRQFSNDGRGGGVELPKTDSVGNPISYKEWDVNPKIPGKNRGAERVVTGSDGSAYYTFDHYRNFVRIK